jgi:hypothetical protein
MLIFSVPSIASGQVSPSRGDVIAYSESQIMVVPLSEDSESEADAICEFKRIYMQDLLVRDLKGKVITETTVGSQVMIEAAVVNGCENQDNHMLVALFEVRDSRDLTIYLTWYNSTINSNQTVEVGASWVAPEVPG